MKALRSLWAVVSLPFMPHRQKVRARYGITPATRPQFIYGMMAGCFCAVVVFAFCLAVLA